MITSMTAFAMATNSAQGFNWTWEVRSVNGKGLDLRVRVPDWIDGLETQARAVVSKGLTRGSVTVSLRLTRDEVASALALDEVHLARVLGAIARIEAVSQDHNVALAPPTATDILALRGVQDGAAGLVDGAVLLPALLADLEPLMRSFFEMRRVEGQALETVIIDQLDQIAELVTQATASLPERAQAQATGLRAALARVLDNSDGADPQRVAQELAMLAVKSDITEELDRLRAHVAAARDLLCATTPVGRKLDFLCQEFNREANTLCSKAGSAALTRIGLDLKAVIDQLREQIQNIE